MPYNIVGKVGQRRLVNLAQRIPDWGLGPLDNFLAKKFVASQICQIVQIYFRNICLVSYQGYQSYIGLVILDYFGKFWEVPGIPLFYSHAKSVQVFLHLLQKGEGIYDRFVLLFFVEFYAVSGQGMAQAQIGLG